MKSFVAKQDTVAAKSKVHSVGKASRETKGGEFFTGVDRFFGTSQWD